MILILKMLMVQYDNMEFEQNKPASEQDIALADSPKIILQPVNGDVRAEPVATNYSHQNEAIFEFEAETIDSTTAQPVVSFSHHATALLVAMGTGIIFMSILALLYINR